MSKSEFYKGRDADQLAQLAIQLREESATEEAHKRRCGPLKKSEEEKMDEPPKKRQRKAKKDAKDDWETLKSQTEWTGLFTIDFTASRKLRLNPIIHNFFPNEDFH